MISSRESASLNVSNGDSELSAGGNISDAQRTNSGALRLYDNKRKSFFLKTNNKINKSLENVT